MAKRRRIPLQDRLDIALAALRGEPIPEIYKRFGVSKPRVYDFRSQAMEALETWFLLPDPGDVVLDLLPGLLELIIEWNKLPRRIAGRFVVNERHPIPPGIYKQWHKIQRFPKLRSYFEDLSELMDAIRRAKFAHGQSWFSLFGLLGKNLKGNWIVHNLMLGYYDGISKAKLQELDRAYKNIETDSDDAMFDDGEFNDEVFLELMKPIEKLKAPTPPQNPEDNIV